MSNRGFLRILIYCSLVVCLLSCNSNQKTDNGIITLRMSIFPGKDDMEPNKQIISAFEKSHPNIKVKVIFAPYNNYTEKILVQTASGITPDVMWMITDDLPYIASRNVLMDITEQVYHDKSIDTSNYFPHALDLCSYKNRLYGLPRDVCCYFYVYNKNMFDEAGVPYPSPDWTWNDFLEICKKLTKDKNHDGHIDQFGTWRFFWVDIDHQNGGSPLSPDGKECWIDKPEFYEAIQFWSDLILKYHVAPTPAEDSGLGNDPFQSGYCAMRLAGPWDFASFKKNLKFGYDIVNLPRGKARNAAELLGLPIAISSKTKYPKEAYELLKFLTYSEEAQRMQSRLGIAMPSRKDLAMSDVYLGQDILPKHINLYMKSLLEYTYPPSMFSYNRQVTSYLDSVVEVSKLGKVSAKEACEEKKVLIEKVIRKAKKRGKA